MGKIISKFRNANRIKEYEECLEILDIVPDKDYILESQLDNGGGGVGLCALNFYINLLGERLAWDIPKVSLQNKIIIVENTVALKALNYFWRCFLLYLGDEAIRKLEIAVGVHLENTYKAMSSSMQESLSCCKDKIGLTLLGYTKEEKQIYDIKKELENSGKEIMYFCEPGAMLNNGVDVATKENRYCMLSDRLYFAYLTKVRVLLTTLYVPLQNMDIVETKILDLEHNFYASVDTIEWKRKEEHIYHNLYYTRIRHSHYVLAHTNKEYRLLQKTCEFYNVDGGKIIKAGYPSLDYGIRQYEYYREKMEDIKVENMILLAPAFFKEIVKYNGFVEFVEYLLDNDYKVVLRMHPAHRIQDEEECGDILKKWKCYNNFFIDESKIWFSEYFLKSFMAISDCSSFGVSFPYISAKYCMYYVDTLEKQGIEIEDIGRYDRNINFIVDNKREAIKVVRQIESLKSSETIKEYCKNEIYNRGKSGKFIADFIIAISSKYV